MIFRNLLFLILFVYNSAFSNEQVRGFLENLSIYSRQYKSKYSTVLQKALKHPLSSKTELLPQDLKLSPEYLKYLVFSSESTYVGLFDGKDICQFMALAINNLIAPVDKIVFEFKKSGENQLGFFRLEEAFRFFTQKGKCQDLIVTRESFSANKIDQIVPQFKFESPKSEKQCLEMHERIRNGKFSPFYCGLNNVLEQSDLAILKLNTQGNKISTNERRRLAKKVKIGNVYREKLKLFNARFIQRFCRYLDSADNFCQSYLDGDVWNAAMVGEFPLEKIRFKCRQVLGRKPQVKKEWDRCVDVLSNVPESCAKAAAEEVPSLFPKPDCEEVSDAIKIGNLNHLYQDCPGAVENHVFVNAARIITHNKKNHLKYKDVSCREISQKIYSDQSFEQDIDSWPLKICYIDPLDSRFMKFCHKYQGIQDCYPFDPTKNGTQGESIETVVGRVLSKKLNGDASVKCVHVSTEDKDRYVYSSDYKCVIVYDKSNCDELVCKQQIYFKKKLVQNVWFPERELTCLSYVPGEDKDNQYSETRIVEKILGRIDPNAQGVKCQMTTSSNYRPTILKFHSGCFIISDEIQCDKDNNCKKRIFFNQKVIKNLNYKGKFIENYFFQTASDQKMTTDKKLELILNKRARTINTLGVLRSFLQKTTGIVHGLACGEDLAPHRYKRDSLNQCSLLPFIVDGTIQKGPNQYVTIRTTLDEVNSPRIIPWNYLYNGLKMYQYINPRKDWALYGIK